MRSPMAQLAYVRQLPSGRWQVRSRGEKGRLVAHGTHLTEVDAKIAAATLAQGIQLNRIEAVLRGEPVRGPSAMAFRDYAARWLATQRGQAATRNSRAHYVRSLNLHWGDRELGEITTADVIAYMEWLTVQPGKAPGTTLSTGTQRNRLIALRAILSAAAAEGIIKVDPSAGLVKPPASRRAARIVTPSEFEAILTHVPHRFRLFFALERYAGLRFNEVPTLTGGNVTAHGIAVITTRDVEGNIRAHTKTGGQRSVPVVPALLDRVNEHKATYGIAAGDWLTTQVLGSPLHYNYARVMWVQACSAAMEAGQLDRSLRLPTQHDLRHSFATDCVHGDVPIFILQAWMGHATISMTQRYYSLSPSAAQLDLLTRAHNLAAARG